MSKITNNHPAYGMIELNRRTSSSARQLFGSNIQVSDTMMLRIHKAEVKRDINRDSYYARDNIIEIEMTPLQFSELITGVGMGGGVSCTIQRSNGKNIPEPKFSNKAGIIREEFKEDMVDLTQKTIELKTEIAKQLIKSKVPKIHQERLNSLANMIVQEIASNIPYMSERFNDEIDRTQTEGKAAFEAYITGKIMKLGFSELEKKINMLPEEPKTKEIE